MAIDETTLSFFKISFFIIISVNGWIKICVYNYIVQVCEYNNKRRSNKTRKKGLQTMKNTNNNA